MWFGSGGTAGKHGVDILLRKGLRFTKFCPISERFCVLDAEGEGRKVCIIAVYMPHDGYKEEEVE